LARRVRGRAGAEVSVGVPSLVFPMLGEHLFCIYGDECSLTPGQNLVFLIKNFGHIDVLSSFNPDRERFDAQGLPQWHRTEVVHVDLRSESDHVAEFVYLAHGIVEDGSDDATVAMSGRSGVAFAQTEVAHEAFPRFVINKFQVHAVGIVHPAGKAVVLA
jgi:hypothetical protein